jgi:hypothetical protein
MFGEVRLQRDLNFYGLVQHSASHGLPPRHLAKPVRHVALHMLQELGVPMRRRQETNSDRATDRLGHPPLVNRSQSCLPRVQDPSHRCDILRQEIVVLLTPTR